MPPDVNHTESAAPELLRLRDENVLLGELLQVDRTALRNFMTYAARTLTRVRTQLQQRARAPAEFQIKLNRLHALYSRLFRRSAALSMPSLALLFEQTLTALEVPRATAACTGDALLPALVRIDEVFLALTMIAQRTGMPLLARRAPRRQARLSGLGAAAALTPASGTRAPKLALALQQLAAQVAAAQDKVVVLTTIDLDQVPEIHAGAFYDMLSQMLRNAIEHGIETPAQRRAAGKSTQGALLVEFQPHRNGQSELVFQDDGQGLNTDRIIQAAVVSGLIAEDAALEQDPRQASTLIFHSGLSTAADAAGRGIGMRILRDNVKRLQGQIQVATKRGRFTRIRIRLPTTGALAVHPVAAQA